MYDNVDHVTKVLPILNMYKSENIRHYHKAVYNEIIIVFCNKSHPIAAIIVNKLVIQLHIMQRKSGMILKLNIGDLIKVEASEDNGASKGRQLKITLTRSIGHSYFQNSIRRTLTTATRLNCCPSILSSHSPPDLFPPPLPFRIPSHGEYYCNTTLNEYAGS